MICPAAVARQDLPPSMHQPMLECGRGDRFRCDPAVGDFKDVIGRAELRIRIAEA
jgi:hypothetical protein